MSAEFRINQLLLKSRKKGIDFILSLVYFLLFLTTTTPLTHLALLLWQQLSELEGSSLVSDISGDLWDWSSESLQNSEHLHGFRSCLLLMWTASRQPAWFLRPMLAMPGTCSLPNLGAVLRYLSC